jgi:lipocalin
MEDEISQHSTDSCWVRFAGKMPAGNILYNILRVQEDERRARIVNPAEKKLWMQHLLNT